MGTCVRSLLPEIMANAAHLCENGAHTEEVDLLMVGPVSQAPHSVPEQMNPRKWSKCRIAVILSIPAFFFMAIKFLPVGSSIPEKYLGDRVGTDVLQLSESVELDAHNFDQIVLDKEKKRSRRILRPMERPLQALGSGLRIRGQDFC